MSGRATNRSRVVAGTVVGTFLASLDVTVVGTAMPSIVGSLGGLDVYPWVFSIYLLTSTSTVPLYGKTADLFGRKPVYLLAVGLFLAGSLGCAAAASMPQLILARALQGLGAGGVLPLTLTIVGDLYPAEQRAKVQGLFSAVWAISSLSGPVLGAWIVERWRWEWVFLLNVPFGLAAALVIALSLHEHLERSEHALDGLGALLLTAAVTSLLWALLEGGRSGFANGPVLGAAGASGLLLVAFGWQERRHPEPMIPPELLRHPVVAITCAAGLFLGAALWGVTSYVPAFIQGVLLGEPSDAGLVLVGMGIGWPLASTATGSAIRRLGYRGTARVGAACLGLGALPLAAVGPGTGRGLLFVDMIVLGLGLGFATTTLLIATQDAVPWNRRGAATGLVQLSRSLGGAVGVAAMGAALTAALQHGLGGRPELLEAASAVLDPRARDTVAAADLGAVAGALGVGLGRVLVAVAGCGATAAAVLLGFPADVPRPTS